MDETLNEEQVNNDKEFIKDLLNEENIGDILRDFFSNNATTVTSFLKALSIVVEEERLSLTVLGELEKESHKVYMENLKTHKDFLEQILKAPNFNGFDKNDILKMINRILEDMKEERKAVRESNYKNMKDNRTETTKRIAIGAAVAGIGVFALAMVMNKGNVSKSIEQTGEVVQNLLAPK